MTDQIAEGSYEAEVKNADGDAELQISQIQECIDEEVSALIINPVDPYGLADILNTAKEKEIPVISYDKLIMEHFSSAMESWKFCRSIWMMEL